MCSLKLADLNWNKHNNTLESLFSPPFNNMSPLLWKKDKWRPFWPSLLFFSSFIPAETLALAKSVNWVPTNVLRLSIPRNLLVPLPFERWRETESSRPLCWFEFSRERACFAVVWVMFGDSLNRCPSIWICCFSSSLLPSLLLLLPPQSSKLPSKFLPVARFPFLFLPSAFAAPSLGIMLIRRNQLPKTHIHTRFTIPFFPSAIRTSHLTDCVAFWLVLRDRALSYHLF